MGRRTDIMEKLKGRIELVTTANGYTYDLKTVTFRKIKQKIHEYNDWELPAVQIIDLAGLYQHVGSSSDTGWNVAIEMCLRTTEVLGTVDQTSLWDLMEDITRSVMADPKLDLSYVRHVKLLDHQTDIHSNGPNHIAILGWQIMFREPITRDNC